MSLPPPLTAAPLDHSPYATLALDCPQLPRQPYPLPQLEQQPATAHSSTDWLAILNPPSLAPLSPTADDSPKRPRGRPRKICCPSSPPSADADASLAEPSPKKRRVSNPYPWVLIGHYTEPAQIEELRKRQKVSKRKVDTQRTGSKVFYRCNAWRRHRCFYHMYAHYLLGATEIALYERGVHNHALGRLNTRALNKAPLKDAYPTMVALPSSGAGAAATAQAVATSNEQLDAFVKAILDRAVDRSPQPQSPSAVLQVSQRQSLPRVSTRPLAQSSAAATDDSSTVESGETIGDVLADVAIKTELDADPSPPPPPPSRVDLASSEQTARLLQLAADLRLALTFDSRPRPHFRFQAGDRAVVLTDDGDTIRVVENDGPIQVDSESWLKADWPQFLWAVRARVRHALL